MNLLTYPHHYWSNFMKMLSTTFFNSYAYILGDYIATRNEEFHINQLKDVCNLHNFSNYQKEKILKEYKNNRRLNDDFNQYLDTEIVQLQRIIARYGNDSQKEYLLKLPTTPIKILTLIAQYGNDNHRSLLLYHTDPTIVKTIVQY